MEAGKCVTTLSFKQLISQDQFLTSAAKFLQRDFSWPCEIGGFNLVLQEAWILFLLKKHTE